MLLTKLLLMLRTPASPWLHRFTLMAAATALWAVRQLSDLHSDTSPLVPHPVTSFKFYSTCLSFVQQEFHLIPSIITFHK